MDRDTLKFIINAVNEKLDNTAEIDAQEIADELSECGIELRVCDTCGHLMIEGYILYDGDEYYCSNECMLEQYTEEEKEEILKEADTDEGTSYWTEWN